MLAATLLQGGFSCPEKRSLCTRRIIDTRVLPQPTAPFAMLEALFYPGSQNRTSRHRRKEKGLVINCGQSFIAAG
jgi:hypothetical protein